MKKSKFTESQIVFALKQAETGVPVAEVCRKLGISEPTFNNWKKKFSGLGTAELRRLRQLEEENARLKQIVADLTLDKQMLQDVLKKSFKSQRAATSSQTTYRRVSGFAKTRLCAVFAGTVFSLLQTARPR